MLISKREAAEMLSVSIRTLERLVNRGELGFYKIGSATRFDDAEIMAYIRSQRQTVIPTEGRPGRPSAGKKIRKCEYYPGMRVV